MHCMEVDRKALRSLMRALRPLIDQVPPQRHPDIWAALALQAITVRLPSSCPMYVRSPLTASALPVACLVAFGDARAVPVAVLAYVHVACNEVPERIAALAHPDALAWLYQYWREPDKDAADAEKRAGRKLNTKHVIAATQLFTEPYMVQWLLQNSLGRSYHEAYPESRLPEQWRYYIRKLPSEDRLPTRPLEELTLIDPCCGSGLFLREAFDMYCAMYKEQCPESQWDTERIANVVLSKHIHGIDLDPMVTAVARLVVYLRAWEYVTTQYPWDTEAYMPAEPLNILGIPADAPEPLRTVGSLLRSNEALRQRLAEKEKTPDETPS